MFDLDSLRVSLTKNGYFKIAELLKVYSPWEVLDRLREHPGIDISLSQIKNILGQNPATGEIPAFWDAISDYGDQALDAFTLVATIFSHAQLIRVFRDASQGRPEFTGVLRRGDLGEKAYTNLAFALACFGTADYRRGARAVEYNFAPVVYHLRNAGGLVQDLIRSKLQRAGWVDPIRTPRSSDREFMSELQAHQFNRVFSMEWPRFEAWLGGQLEMPPFIGRFGLREIGLFVTPLPPPAGD